MPGWAVILGSGGFAGLLVALLAPVINHKLQRRRDQDRVSREVQAAYVARQRELCITLLEAVIRFKHHFHTIRSFHDDRASRRTTLRSVETELQQFPSDLKLIVRARRELDLEPNAQLQGAIERFGAAAAAYNLGLSRAMVSSWNPFKVYVGKAPQSEVDRLAGDFDTRAHELQDAVRTYLASLEAPSTAAPVRRLPKLTKLHWPPWRHRP